MAKTVRRLKVHSKYRLKGRRNYQILPWLNVSGVWLATAGFAAGQPIEVTIEKRMLTIKACSNGNH